MIQKLNIWGVMQGDIANDAGATEQQCVKQPLLYPARALEGVREHLFSYPMFGPGRPHLNQLYREQFQVAHIGLSGVRGRIECGGNLCSIEMVNWVG